MSTGNLKVYFISGLAADSSVFRWIKLPEHCEAVYLDWIPPQKGETLCDYSLRLAEKIDPSGPFAFVGLSMGGMIATELSRIFHPKLTVLISSIPCSRHLPPYFRFAGRIRLQRVVPVTFLKKASIIKRLFTPESREDKALLRKMIRNSDPFFIKWAVDAILNWNCTEVPSRLLHIHGTRDEVLPIRYTQPTHVIPKGGHLMVFNRAGEINAILGQALKEI